MVPKKWGRGGNSWIIHVLVCKLRKTFAATKSGGGGVQPVPLIVRAWFTWHVWWCLSRYVASFLKAGGDLTSKKLNFLTLNFPQKGGSSFKIQLSIYEKLKFCCEKRAPPPLPVVFSCPNNITIELTFVPFFRSSVANTQDCLLVVVKSYSIAKMIVFQDLITGLRLTLFIFLLM